MSDGWYLPGKEMLETDTVQNAWNRNVEFFQRESRANASELKYY